MWQRIDKKAKCFLTTLSQGPKWSTVSRRIERHLHTMECIEDIVINSTLVTPTCTDAFQKVSWEHKQLCTIGIRGYKREKRTKTHFQN